MARLDSVSRCCDYLASKLVSCRRIMAWLHEQRWARIEIQSSIDLHLSLGTVRGSAKQSHYSLEPICQQSAIRRCRPGASAPLTRSVGVNTTPVEDVSKNHIPAWELPAKGVQRNVSSVWQELCAEAGSSVTNLLANQDVKMIEGSASTGPTHSGSVLFSSQLHEAQAKV